MHAGNNKFRKIFEGNCTYKGFANSVRGRLGTNGRKLAAAVMFTTELAADDVHSTFIRPGRDRQNRFARWVINNTTDALKNILVLFAAQGAFIYQPIARVQGVIQVCGETDWNILEQLKLGFGPIAHIAWGVATSKHEDAAVLSESQTVARLKVELAASQRLIAELMRTNSAPGYAPGHGTVHAVVAEEPDAGTAGRSFKTYDRKTRGFH
jgi:hypothetical protein